MPSKIKKENIEYNKRIRDQIENRYKVPITDKKHLGYGELSNKFICNICGEFISTETVWYYHGIPEYFKCYECQEKEIEILKKKEVE